MNHITLIIDGPETERPAIRKKIKNVGNGFLTPSPTAILHLDPHL
jgi:hypothetical protein